MAIRQTLVAFGQNGSYFFNNMSVAGVIMNAESPWKFLRFYYMDDDQAEPNSANYDSISAIGRTIPMIGYEGMNNKQISVKLYFVGDVLPIIQVYHNVKWLETFLYPRDNGVMVKAPCEIILCLGLYTMMRGVIESVDVTWQGPYAGIGISGLSSSASATFLNMFPVHAEVDITIRETRDFWTGGQRLHKDAEHAANLQVTRLFAMSGIPSAGIPGILNSVLFGSTTLN